MLSFLNNFFSATTYLGIDIGTSSIKIASVTQGKTPKLNNYAYLESLEYLERANAAFYASTLQVDEHGMASYIKALMKQSNVAVAPVIASIPAFAAFTTLIETPKLSEKEINQSVPLHAKQYIPIPLSESTLDWVKISEREDPDGTKKMQLLIISVPNDIVARYKNIFKLAGLELAALEIESMSLARSLTTVATAPQLIIDIGSRSTAFAVAQSGILHFTAQTDFGGASLTQTIATGMGVAMQRAEEVKRRRGLSVEGGEQELYTLLQPIVDVILNEGRRVKSQYEATYKQPIEQVLLAGGGAHLQGLDKYVTQELGIPCERAQPFTTLMCPNAMDSVKGDLGVLFAVAVGLALKKME